MAERILATADTVFNPFATSLQVLNVRVSPMERDNDGATPLHFAAARGIAKTSKQTVVWQNRFVQRLS